jgi:hypothetical protein
MRKSKPKEFTVVFEHTTLYSVVVTVEARSARDAQIAACFALAGAPPQEWDVEAVGQPTVRSVTPVSEGAAPNITEIPIESQGKTEASPATHPWPAMPEHLKRGDRHGG